jgi:hypothetical protein
MSTNKRKRPGKPVNHPPIINLDTGEVFETYTEAGRSVGGSRFGVMKCCTGLQNHHYGYKFRFIKEKKK